MGGRSLHGEYQRCNAYITNTYVFNFLYRLQSDQAFGKTYTVWWSAL